MTHLNWFAKRLLLSKVDDTSFFFKFFLKVFHFFFKTHSMFKPLLLRQEFAITL